MASPEREKWSEFEKPPQIGVIYVFRPFPLFCQIGKRKKDYYILLFSFGIYLGKENGEHIFKGPPHKMYRYPYNKKFPFKGDKRQKKIFRLPAPI